MGKKIEQMLLTNQICFKKILAQATVYQNNHLRPQSAKKKITDAAENCQTPPLKKLMVRQ